MERKDTESNTDVYSLNSVNWFENVTDVGSGGNQLSRGASAVSSSVF
jgi:hypothetical protein